MIKIFADTGNLAEIAELDKNPLVQGFTTNPTIMRKAGISDYKKWAKEALSITKKPLSFEVFADEFIEMVWQARTISSWGRCYVKIPITNTEGSMTTEVIRELQSAGVMLNITAIMVPAQVAEVMEVIDGSTPIIISYFAGRLADTGNDPVQAITYAKGIIGGKEGVELLWASSREVYNIYEAERAGADIITVTPELIRKYEAMKGKFPLQLSLETVQMFYNDGKAAGYTL